jgi:hypothetical protein
MPLFYWIFIFVAFLSACGEFQDDSSANELLLETQNYPLRAYCQADVIGVGSIDTETVYLPSVVNCENGGAPLEALKAQAVAARSYLYYNMETSEGIEDGQSDQVYSCNRSPRDIHFQAVRETSGEVLTYRNKVIAAFFVAGSIPTDLQTCIPDPNDPNPASTEKYVTYNEGLSGMDIEQTTLGWVNPEFTRNRGCQSQNGARCLANLGWQYQDILRFYYGEDIVFTKATGACVEGNMPNPVVDMAIQPMVMDQGVNDQGINQQDQNLNPNDPPQDQMLDPNSNQDQAFMQPNPSGDSTCSIEGQSASLRAQASCVSLGCVSGDSWEADPEGNFRTKTKRMNSCKGSWRFKINLSGTYELRMWGPSWVNSGMQVKYVLSGGVYASALEGYLWPQSWNLIGKFAFTQGDVIELTVLNQSNNENLLVPFSSLMIREEGFIQEQEANGIQISAYDAQGNVVRPANVQHAPVVGCDQKSLKHKMGWDDLLLNILSFMILLLTRRSIKSSKFHDAITRIKL